MACFVVAMLPIKKTPQSKCRLPVLNWCPMKPNQVKGTVFAEMDDERLYLVRVFDIFTCHNICKLTLLSYEYLMLSVAGFCYF